MFGAADELLDNDFAAFVLCNLEGGFDFGSREWSPFSGRETAEHPFATIKAWMGATHFLTKRLPRVSTEMSLHVLAYNLKRVMQIVGVVPLMQAMRA